MKARTCCSKSNGCWLRARLDPATSWLIVSCLLLLITTVPFATAQSSCNFIEDWGTYKNLRCTLSQYCSFLTTYYATSLGTSSVTCEGNVQGAYSISLWWPQKCVPGNIPGQWNDKTEFNGTVCYTAYSTTNYNRLQQINVDGGTRFTQGLTFASSYRFEYCSGNDAQVCSCKTYVNNLQCQACQMCSNNKFSQDCSNLYPGLSDTCADDRWGDLAIKIQAAVGQPSFGSARSSPATTNNDSSESNVVTVVVVVLVLVLLVVVLACGYWCYKRKRAQNQSSPTPTAKGDVEDPSKMKPEVATVHPEQVDNSISESPVVVGVPCVVQEVMKEIVHNPDGSTTHKTTVTTKFPDGTQSVTQEAEIVFNS